ncbi:MAG: alpha/beta hydrolase [Bacteroidota bacterium]|nr:alpha/beta hydrolase [Candidatus Kapabacteria bacterium]MDW8220471.1 alpha/beta hydrolase [Bacteroidota bacterium]
MVDTIAETPVLNRQQNHQPEDVACSQEYSVQEHRHHQSTDCQQAENEILYEEHDVFANGINIHYGRWYSRCNDEVGSPTAVCVHGLTANHRCWGTYAKFLVQHGVNVIGYDLRGRGLSSKPQKGYGVFGHLSDLAAFLRETGVEKPIIIGHSLGAMIGMAFAAEHPHNLSHLIMIDAGAPPTLAQLMKIMVVLRPSLARLNSTFRSPERYIEIIKSAPFIGSSWNEVIEDHCRYELEEVNGRWKCNIPLYVLDQEFQSFGGAIDPLVAIANALMDPIGLIMKAWPPRYFPYDKIQVPTLVLRAPGKNREAGDEFLTEDGMMMMKREIKDATVMTVPNTNHYTIVFAEHPERDKAILDFLTRD